MLVWPYIILLFSVDCAWSKDNIGNLNENLNFLMFENFDLNRQNFIDELKIVSELKMYREDLKIWHDYLKNALDKFKQRKLDAQLPKSSYNTLKRFHVYNLLLKTQYIRIRQVSTYS